MTKPRESMDIVDSRRDDSMFFINILCDELFDQRFELNAGI